MLKIKLENKAIQNLQDNKYIIFELENEVKNENNLLKNICTDTTIIISTNNDLPKR